LNPRHRRYERSNRSLHHRSGNCFVGERPRAVSATSAQSIAARTRDTTALARPPPRYVMRTGGIRTRFSQVRSIRALHHRQTVSRGTGDVGLGSLANEVSRVFTTWNSNSPSFPHDKGFGAAGNKNPSGAWLWRGSNDRTLNGLSPFHLREKARARRRRPEPMAQARSSGGD
jgi:hypothetical protein